MKVVKLKIKDDYTICVDKDNPDMIRLATNYLINKLKQAMKEGSCMELAESIDVNVESIPNNFLTILPVTEKDEELLRQKEISLHKFYNFCEVFAEEHNIHLALVTFKYMLANYEEHHNDYYF